MAAWPDEPAAAFRAYRHERCGGSWVDRRPPTAGVDGSYWLLLPGLLHRRHAGRSGALPADLLDDVLWAQYCVFLAVRTQDDLLDGQARSPRLAAAAELLHAEATRALEARIPPPAPFWPVYGEALRRTLGAIARVDRMQRSAAGMPPDSLSAYAEVGEIFKIGSAAVCFALGRAADLSALGRGCDHLAVASQLLDDLVDLREDQELGRRSFAISWILRRGRQGEPAAGSAASEVWDGLLRTPATSELLDLARDRLRRAAGAFAPLDLPELGLYVELLLEEVDLFERHLRRARVGMVLGPGSRHRRPGA